MTAHHTILPARIAAAMSAAEKYGAAKQKWISDQVDRILDAERADGVRVFGRCADSGYSYLTRTGEIAENDAWDDAEHAWNACEAELRRLMAEFDAAKYSTPTEHAFNEISDAYDRDLVEAVCTALEEI